MAAVDGVPTYKQPLQRVMPAVFVAGPAKSGSTFLWECIQQSFHPEQVCGGRRAGGWSDEACSARRFVLPALVADVQQPACFRFQKESAFWRYWGRKQQVSWARYGGPRLPLDWWELGSVGAACPARRRALSKRERGIGPRAFAGTRQMEDLCMQDIHCPALAGGDGGSTSGVPYHVELPEACKATCSPCDLHPGWMNNFDAPCPFAPAPCDSAVCANAPYVPKALRRQNFSAHHARAFSISSAFVSDSALADANVSAARVMSLEGNPGLFQTPPRHAL